MKPFILTLSLIPALLFAGCSREHQKPDNVRAGMHNKAYNTGYERAVEPSTAPRRLESVTWNSVRHELTWEVSKGPGEKKDSDSDGTFKPTAKDRYQIDMDNATMTFNGKTRRFSETEAANVRTLMDVIARYAVESTIWWEEGQGEPLDGDGQPLTPARPKTNDKPKAVGTPSQVVRLTGALEQLAAVLTPPLPGSAAQ